MRKVFITFLITLVLIFTLSSCGKPEENPSDYEKIGYTCRVVFDANGGIIQEKDSATILCKPDSLILEPGGKNTVDDKGGTFINPLTAPKFQGKVFVGWYRGEKDESGTVKFGKIWNFSKDKVEESITLYAYWQSRYHFIVNYGLNFDQTIDKTFTSETYPDDLTPFDYAQIDSVEGYTFEKLYLDKDFKVPYDFTNPTNYDKDKNLNLYAKYLNGNFNVIRNVKDLYIIDATENLYFIKDIDCTGIAASNFKWADTFRGKIIGNGYTISNLNINKATLGTSNTTLGLFNIISNASISDLTFKNCTLTVDFGPFNDGKLAFFAGKIENSEIKNLKFDSCNLIYNKDKNGVISDTDIYTTSNVSTDTITILENCKIIEN